VIFAVATLAQFEGLHEKALAFWNSLGKSGHGELDITEGKS
jgi:hypothetical protein